MGADQSRRGAPPTVLLGMGDAVQRVLVALGRRGDNAPVGSDTLPAPLFMLIFVEGPAVVHVAAGYAGYDSGALQDLIYAGRHLCSLDLGMNRKGAYGDCVRD